MKVECAYKELWPIEKVVPNPKNYNRHPEKQIQMLAKIIQETGWRAPIVVSLRSGLVVKGHARLAAAKLAGFAEVPVDLQAYASDAQEIADLIADNKIAELAETDDDLLAGLLMDMPEEIFELAALDPNDETIKVLRQTFSATDAEKLETVEPMAGDDFLNQMAAPNKPKLPIIPIYAEHHQAFVIICDNKIDEAFIRDKLGLTAPRASYADVKFVKPNVIHAKEVIEQWK